MNTIIYTTSPLGYMFHFAGMSYALLEKQDMIDLVTKNYPMLEFNFVQV